MVGELLMPQIDKWQHGGGALRRVQAHTTEQRLFLRFQRKGEACYVRGSMSSA